MGRPMSDSNLTKKAHTTEKFTEQQVKDLIACSNPENGYIHFARNFFHIQHPTKGQMLLDLFDYQERLMQGYHDYRHTVVLCSRQLGKTTCAAAYLLWYAMFHPDQTILIAAHKFTGAQEIMHRIRYGYECCPDYIRAGVVNYNKGSLDFDNGSRIVSQTTTATTGRGMSISLLFLDEFSYVGANIATEFYTSISPTLSTGGKSIISSTPNSDEDQFAQIWKESQEKYDDFGNEIPGGLGRNGYFGVAAYWHEHPDRGEEFKRDQISKLGMEKWRREFECEFLVDSETLIDSQKLGSLTARDPIYKQGEVRWYKHPTPDNIYMVSLDPSLGTGGDYAAIQIYELPSLMQVGEWHHNLTSIQEQIKLMRDVLRYIQSKIGILNSNSIYWSMENNSVGEAGLVVVSDLGEDSFPGMFLSEPVGAKGSQRKFRKGFNTTFRSKISACSRLKFFVEHDRMRISSKPLLSELKAYIASGSSFKAKHGTTDDLVSATLLIIRMAVALAEWDPKVFESLSIRDSFEDEWDMPMPVFVNRYM